MKTLFIKYKIQKNILISNYLIDSIHINQFNIFNKLKHILYFKQSSLKLMNKSSNQIIELDRKINQISNKFKQLKTTQNNVIKTNTIFQLRKLSTQATNIIEKQQPSANNVRKQKQIDDILKKCIEIQKNIPNNKLQKQNRSTFIELRNISSFNTNRNSINQQEYINRMSKAVARSIISYELQSQNLKITQKQLDEIAYRMERNHQVMKEIQSMVKEQGADLEQIQLNLQQTYANTVKANDQLKQAIKLQNQNRILKIKLAVTGIFAAFGLKVLGIPGMIVGFFGGLFTIMK